MKKAPLPPHRSMTRWAGNAGRAVRVQLYTLNWDPIQGAVGSSLKEARDAYREILRAANCIETDTEEIP